MSASQAPQLCATCRNIDFAAYFKNEGHKDADLKCDELGKRLQIRKKEACAFCCLVDTTLSNTDLGYDENADVLITQSCICDNHSGNAEDDANVYCIKVEARRAKPIPVFTGNIQILADDAPLVGGSPTFRARLPQGDRFDMALARRWLEICRKEHGHLCSTPGDKPEEQIPSPQPVDLLAIDLGDMCICKMPFGSRFIVLSYCWPVKRYLVHLTSNSKELFEKGSMLRNMDRLPRTIQDAINCGKELGFRYLWIDALNIIQDSDEHKAVQLRQMDRVYNAAELTIVCAYPVPSGTEDPCGGLPGYAQYAITRQRAVRTVKGLRMMVTSRCVDKVLPRTRWDTRCWTYQEQHLSRRLLYFTHEQVYFSCSCNIYCEDMHGEDVKATAYIEPGATFWSQKARYSREDTSDYGQWVLSRAPIEGMMSKITTFERALDEYSYRAVSYPSDVLNAFEGIRTILSEAMGTCFWQGLPGLFFDLALCWVLRGPFRKRRLQSESFLPAKPLFPSWSWAGWESRVNLNKYMLIYEYRSEIDWYIISQNGAATRVQTSGQTRFQLAYGEDGNKNVSPPEADIKHYLPNVITSDEIDTTSSEWQNAKVLSCWTTKALFWLDGSAHSLYGHERVWHLSTNAAIKDANGNVAGCILIPEDMAEECAVEPMRWEFILVSRSSQRKSSVFEKALQYFDAGIYPDRDWCTLNVMMITRVAEGKAVRVGVGIIHEDAWVGARPEGAFIQLV